jgi:hypothetical protein
VSYSNPLTHVQQIIWVVELLNIDEEPGNMLALPASINKLDGFMAS